MKVKNHKPNYNSIFNELLGEMGGDAGKLILWHRLLICVDISNSASQNLPSGEAQHGKRAIQGVRGQWVVT